MKTITYYKYNGEIVKEDTLNGITIKNCHGMKIRCILIDGSTRVGYANPYYSFEKGCTVCYDKTYCVDYIVLETFVNLDDTTHTFLGEEEHKYDMGREAVPIALIAHVDAILHSGLRWGVPPTNKFDLKTI
ncbi:MAG: hypothetical protein IJ518_08050 [Clostridia bacterium]|nr:hypothetical protein [Clostridia bacterium]